MPPVFDPLDGKLHYFQGYGDAPLSHDFIPTTNMICHCQPGMNTFGDKVHDIANYLNVNVPPLGAKGSTDIDDLQRNSIES